jgi:hypothetical protein
MSDTNNETQEIINDLKAKSNIPIKGNTADFLAKFTQKQTDDGKPSADNFGDPMLGRETTDELSNDNESVDEIIGNDNEGKKPLISMDKKKPGFVQKQIEENKRLKEELEKYKNEEVPKYTSKIEELENLVKTSQTTAEANHYQDQLNKASEAKVELEQTLSKEIADLKGQLEYYDITQSADYKERFVAPVESAYAEAHEIVSADPESLRLFNEATTTHLAAYKAANPEERTALMQRKRELLKEINKTFYEDTYSQVRLNEAFRKWEKSLDGHMNALNNWQQTKQDISRQVKEKELKNRTDFLNTWRNSYKEQAQAVENETQITDDIADFMKEKGIKFDTSRDDAIALAATQQSDEVASVDEMNRLINQGRSYKKLQALVKAQSEMLKEKTDYINKLKGASKPSSAPATTENKQRVSIPEGLAAKLARFGPRLATT